MIVLSFLHIIAFACIAEYLRTTVFLWSKVFNNPMAGLMKPKDKGDTAAKKKDTAAVEPEVKSELVFKSENVK